MVVLIVSLLVTAIPALYIKFVPLDLGPREKLVNGEQHLTLTGWDRKDYSILRHKPDTVVLQMANPDVTDQTLEPLKEMKALQELDLNGTQVTDAGLVVLKDLPRWRGYGWPGPGSPTRVSTRRSSPRIR